MQLHVAWFAVGLISLAACTNSPDPPAEADYTLIWYPREGTDFGRIVPGFTSLSMCRYSGASQTMEYLISEHGYQTSYANISSPPWFECGAGCRVEAGSKAVVCEQIDESRGTGARAPAVYGES